MKSRYRIKLGDTHLDSLDNDILILDIQHSQPDRNIAKQTVANLDGYDVANITTGQRSVTVTFEIHTYDIAARNAVCQLVNKWAANGGTLRTNDRDGQHLEEVICEQYAEIDSAKNWTDPLTVVFSTTVNPNWVADKADVLTLTGTSTNSNLAVKGSPGIFAPVTATVTPAAKLTSLQITVGSSKVVLTGMNIAKNTDIKVDHISGRFLRIRSSGKSLMAYVNPNKTTDRLVAESGARSKFSISSDAKVTVKFEVEGCYR